MEMTPRPIAIASRMRAAFPRRGGNVTRLTVSRRYPGRSGPAQKRYQDGNAKAACVGLAAAATAFDDAYGQGGLAGTLTNATNLISAVDKALTPGFGGTKIVGDDPIPGFFPPKMATDLPALTGLAGFPMETSSADAGALQADCDSVGVTAPIWPQYPITP
jgi:hypothetical protein